MKEISKETKKIRKEMARAFAVSNLKLSLTEREIEFLRNSTSDLGTTDPTAVSLQLKIAHAILDARLRTIQKRKKKFDI